MGYDLISAGKKKTNTSNGYDLMQYVKQPPATTQPEFYENATPDYTKYLTTSHAVSSPVVQPTQPSTWDQVKAGDIKGILNQVGLGLSQGLANTGAAKQNVDIANMLTNNPLPGMADIGRQQLAGIQTNQEYLKANPAESLPAIIGKEIPSLPLWMAGEGAVGALGKGIGKLFPSVIPAAEKVGSRIPSFIKGGLTDAAAYGGVVAPTQNIQEGGSIRDLLEREKQIPNIALGGVAARGAFKGIGEGAKLGKDVLGEGGSLKQALELRKLNIPEIKSNPLEDVQNAYKTTFSLQDIKSANPVNRSVQRGTELGTLRVSDRITPQYKARQSELTDAFKDLPIGSTKTPLARNTLQENIDSSMGISKPTEVYQGLDAFGKPLQNYKLNTDAKNTIAEITDKMDKKVQDIAKSMRQADGQTKVDSIRSQVKARGGIKQGNADIFEEQKVIPNWIRNDKGGMALDQMADEMKMSADELLRAIDDSAYSKKDYITEAYRVAYKDPEYQALSNTLDKLKADSQGKVKLLRKDKITTPDDFPFPIKDIPIIRYQKEVGPATYSDLRGGTWYNRVDNVHGENTGYNADDSAVGGMNKLAENYTPKKPLLVKDTESAGAGDAAIRAIKGEKYLDDVYEAYFDGQESINTLLSKFGIPEQEATLLMKHPEQPQVLLDRVGTELAKQNGYDSIVHTTPNGLYAEIVKLDSSPGRIKAIDGPIKLKPRELTPKTTPEILPIESFKRLKPSGSLPVDEVPRPVKKLTPVAKEKLIWTNKDGIGSSGAKMKDIPKRGEVPGKLEVGPAKVEGAKIGDGMDPKLVSSRKVVNEDVFWNKVKSQSKWQGDIPSLQEGIKSGQVNIDELPPEMAKEVRLKMNLQMFGASADPSLPEPQSKIIIGKQKEKINFKNAWDKFYTAIVNTQQPIANAAKVTGSDIGKLASNTKNVSGIIDHNFLTALVDKQGNKVGESLKSTVEAIPKGQEEKFWTYMSQRHNIDRARQESHEVPKVDKQGFLVKDKEGNQLYDTVIDKKPTPVQANYTSKMSKDAVRIAERDNPEYKAIGDGIVKWLDDFMRTWGVDTGVVNKDIYSSLRETYKSYFPTQRDFSELEKAIPDNVSQKFANQRTPIRKATGSERDIKDPIENIMNLVDRTIRTAKYNEVGQSLLNSVREAPEKLKPLAEVIPTKDGMFSNLDNVITVLEDGKPVYLKINDKMLLDAMNGLPKSIGSIPVLSTLTNGFKSLITQKNPLFAIRNIFRDIPTSYVYGSESNPFKFGKGILGASKDVLTNSQRLQKYKAVGGGGGNFFSSGDVTKSASELMNKGSVVKKIAMKPIKAIESFNTLTETVPRLAEFNRVLDKTGDITKALYASNDVTVNFSRGGNITKNVDKIAPYANAGVQGLDRFFRGFSSPKVALATMAKAGVAITVPDVALYMINRDNPNYQALDNRTKDSYFLIPKEGGKTFIKVPKSRELGVLFGSLFERSMRVAEGQKEPFKGFGNAVKTNFSPTNPFDSNFFSPATFNIYTNKDFANRAIVPQGMLMDKRSKYLQYDDKTTEIAKEIGRLSTNIPGIPGGLSPKQLDYLVKSYSGVIGQFGTPLLVPGGSPGKVLSTQFSADPKFSNQATTDFYDKLDKLSSAAVDKNILEKIPAKKLTKEEDIKNSMVGVSSALNRGTKLINKIQASSDPDKESKINTIKSQMLQLTMRANSAKDAKAMQQVETYSKKFFTK